EMALVSARKSRLQQWANEGNGRAQQALELTESPNRFLSTVQIGITLVGVLAGAFGGATIAERMAAGLGHVAWLAPYSRVLSVGFTVVGITYLTLVLGELVPKRLALHAPERIACAVAALMRALSVATAPVVHLLSLSTDAVLRLLGVRSAAEVPITPEEIGVLLRQATQAGVFRGVEQDMVEGVLRLNNRRVSLLAIPRTEIAWLEHDATAEEIRAHIASVPYNQYPVCEGSLDNVIGVVRARDLLVRCLAGEPLDLRALAHPPLFIPETMLAAKALELLRQSPVHMAFVMDEYGGLQGLVTIHNIVEEIVGDIVMTRPQATRRKDGSWLVDGMLPIQDFKALFQIKRLPGEERDTYQTVGGFVMTYLGRIPAPADHFTWGGLRFEVMDMDGRRVDKVLVTPLKPSGHSA
ncbi:MAG: hemolysin family protein, partial [Anaerolineae bacterium]|nr:hemolysin family protein [Anaerolineae bacterium]MDW8071270.1 hemolysin family protein [Anaerolineae bacterium]